MSLLERSARRALLALAREAIRAHLTGEGPAPAGQAGLSCAGVFVTIRREGELRGCIGCFDKRPLDLAVSLSAVAAATEDPRFPPLELGDLERVTLEISILGPPEAFDDPSVVEIGRHGLVVEQTPFRGLLLPQVALEWGWSTEEFLAHTCRKAGLAPDAWRQGARLFRFEAEVFGE
jgi:uncharacterized protein